MSNNTLTAIFLIGSGIGMLDFYNFNQLKMRHKLNLIAIVNKDIVSNFPIKQKDYFDQIYPVASNKVASLSHLDFSAVEDVVKQELIKITDPSKIRIFPFNEYNILLAAQLREKFEIPGASSDLLKPFRDKVVMKNILNGNNIRTPKFISLDMKNIKINTEDYFKNLSECLGLPFILKPIDGAGSLGVKKICSLHDFIMYKNELLPMVSGYEAEEFLDGELYHCDIVFRNQNPILSLCGIHNRPLLEFKNGQNVGSIPLADGHPLKESLIQFTQTAMKNFNLPDGIIHSEIFYLPKADEFVFLEAAARAPGALIVPMYEQSFGCNILDIDFLIQINSTQIVELRPDSYCFWIIFPPIAGKIKKLHQPKINSEYELEWFVNKGDVLKPPVSLRDRVGRIFVWNHDYDALAKDFECISNHKFLETEL